MSKKALREGKYKVENWPTYNKQGCSEKGKMAFNLARKEDKS